MFYDKIFIKRDLKMFLNEAIYQKNDDCIIIRPRSRNQLSAYAQLIPMQFLFDKSKGAGIKTLLYCLDGESVKDKDGISVITGMVVKLDGAKIIDAEDFSVEFSDYDLKFNSKLIKHDGIDVMWRKNIVLHLDEDTKKQYIDNYKNLEFFGLENNH